MKEIKTLEERKQDYIKLLKELKELGQEIMEEMDNEEETIFSNKESEFYEEIETMETHIDICREILTNNI